ncbi:FAD dependent oxidoreductase [gamma proteobacterium IMCC1989]|nr:FAD dependent oxidoreductase [gamma proteobacterium IMCC1989]
MTQLSTDIIIIGGGVAGLWIHHRLNDLGYHAVLIEKHSIGNGQTLSSQGIIHGGTKYTLNGILTGAASAIADMPQRWLDCLAGSGEIDLSQTKLLTQHQLMWSTQSVSSKLTSFLSSKALNGKMQSLSKKSYPDIFNTAAFKGNLYQLNEPVLDIPSLLKNLTEKWQHRIICTNEDYQFIETTNCLINGVISDTFEIQAKKVILSSGEGNEESLQKLNIDSPKMQRRPLQMVLMKSIKLPRLYAHCIGASTKPIATITSHTHSDGDNVWYIGGNIAEEGIDQTSESLIKHTRFTLQKILPWLDTSDAEWTTHCVNRAEPAQKNLLRPDTAFLADAKNIAIAWPTKLALTPNLADQLIHTLKEQSIMPSSNDGSRRDSELEKINQQHPVVFSPSLWDRAFDAKS